MIVSQFESGSIPKTVDDYNLDNVSLKVSRIILSHIDYVNRTVWKKQRNQNDINENLVISQYFFPENFRINDLVFSLFKRGIKLRYLLVNRIILKEIILAAILERSK